MTLFKSMNYESGNRAGTILQDRLRQSARGESYPMAISIFTSRPHAPTQQVCLFEIPIYWCDEKKFYSDYDRKLAAQLAGFERQTRAPLTESLRVALTDSFWRNYIAPWRFNQIVGWIRIHQSGKHIRAELWYMSAKRPSRWLTKKHFSSHGRAFDITILPEQSNGAIFQSLRESLAAYGRANPKYFLDVRCFSALGPFVNWRKLTKT